MVHTKSTAKPLATATPNLSLNSFSKEQLKAFFYLAVGKIDSNIKFFKRKILVEYQDLLDLNTLIQEKLNNYATTCITSVNIYYEKNKMSEFGVWKEFTENNWQIPEVIKNITIIWDFLVQLPNYSQPQRHTLTVKISSEINFAFILPAILSGNISDVDDIDLRSSPVVCQVNFINHLLSDELIHIVDKWVETRKETLSITAVKKWMQDKKKLIFHIIHYSIPIFVTFALLAILYNYSKNLSNTLTTNILIYTMYWLLISIILIFSFWKIAHHLAHLSLQALTQYGDFLILKITRGDINKQLEIDKNNKKEFRKFLFSCFLSFVINILSAIATYVLFNLN